jgi:hypothetical protein
VDDQVHLDRRGEPRCTLDLLQRASREQEKLMQATSGGAEEEAGQPPLSTSASPVMCNSPLSSTFDLF